MTEKQEFNQTQYSKNFQQYLDSNLDGGIGGGNIDTRVTLLKKYLPTGKTVFEIGSAGGSEALALKEAGYKVIASDYVQEFVYLLKNKGLNAVSYDAKKDTLPVSIDCIYANAVFVHFTPDEFSSFLVKSKSKLQNEKIIFLSVIKGIGHERSGRNRGIERDFYYYTTELLQQIAINTGCKILYLNDDDPKWIQAIITCK